jgi:hypothetical protein
VWASCMSVKPTVTSAVEDAAASIMQHYNSQQQQQQQSAGGVAGGSSGFQPDVALVFASCNYGSQLQDVVAAVRRAAPSVRAVFGCSVGAWWRWSCCSSVSTCCPARRSWCLTHMPRVCACALAARRHMGL